MQRSEGRALCSPWRGPGVGTQLAHSRNSKRAVWLKRQGRIRVVREVGKDSREHARRLRSAVWLSSEVHLEASGRGGECANRGEVIWFRFCKDPSVCCVESELGAGAGEATARMVGRSLREASGG